MCKKCSKLVGFNVVSESLAFYLLMPDGFSFEQDADPQTNGTMYDYMTPNDIFWHHIRSKLLVFFHGRIW